MIALRGEFALGWRLVAGSMIGIAGGVSSLYFYAQGCFIKPLSAAFGWSRGETSLGPLIGTACAAAMAIPVGGLVDRLGSKRVAIGSLLLLSAFLALLGLATGGLVSFLALTALLSLATAGSSPLPFMRLIVAGFRHHRGLAVGMAMAGTGLGAIAAPALLTPYIATHGWRAGYIALSAVVAMTCVPVFLLIGDREPDVGTAPSVALFTILRDRAFRVIGGPVCLASTAVLGFIVHFVPMLTDAGIDPAIAGRIAGLIGVSAIAGRLLIGAAFDRWSPAAVTAVLFTLAAGGMLLLALGGMAMAYPGSLILGLAVGAEGNVIAVMTARHFSRLHYGKAYGALYALFLVGGAIGPALVGWLFDVSGGYRAALGCGAMLLLIAAVAVFGVRGLRVVDHDGANAAKAG